MSWLYKILEAIPLTEDKNGDGIVPETTGVGDRTLSERVWNKSEFKRNTNLMQHCAGFISAGSLYMFRAQPAQCCIKSHHTSLLGPEALIRRCDDLPATITHVPVAAVLVLNIPDDGRLRPKHVE